MVAIEDGMDMEGEKRAHPFACSFIIAVYKKLPRHLARSQGAHMGTVVNLRPGTSFLEHPGETCALSTRVILAVVITSQKDIFVVFVGGLPCYAPGPALAYST
jgi:hypothetical protein